MGFSDDKVKELLDGFAAGKATPGGGSAAALAGALAAALAAMVAGLTMNKKGYETVQEEMAGIQKDAEGLMHELTALIDRDSEAYSSVMAAFKLPKTSADEKAARSDAIQKATIEATVTPLDTMRAACKVADLLVATAERGNRNAHTDAAVGGLLMAAAVEGAYRNVAINLDGIKDRATADKLSGEAETLLAQSREMANFIRRTLFDN